MNKTLSPARYSLSKKVFKTIKGTKKTTESNDSVVWVFLFLASNNLLLPVFTSPNLRINQANLLGFQFLLNDDSWCYHHHQVRRLVTDTNVLEQSVDIRKVAEERNARLSTAFRHPLDSTHQDSTAVRNTDHRTDRGNRNHRLLNRPHLERLSVALRRLYRRR